MASAIDKLIGISIAPSDPNRFAEWIRCEDAVSYLSDSAQDDEFVVFASVWGTFLHAVFVPSSLLAKPDVDDLLGWNGNPWLSSWGVWSAPGKTSSKVWMGHPLEDIDSRAISQGEQIVFGRTFRGREGNPSYFEVLQKFLHITGLHFLEERNAYCRLDERGDVESVIKIIRVPPRPQESPGWIITVKRQYLDDYMTLTDAWIVRMFDVVRVQQNAFSGWKTTSSRTERPGEDLYFNLAVQAPQGGYMRGIQIIRPSTDRELILKRLAGIRDEKKQYASFIAFDFKNNSVKEISCAPDATANYFTKFHLPFETSPVFFRADVLAKYKADPDKYCLQDRTIECRDTWYLKTYDINEAGQVHTYIVYLRNLPYEEQLHWKAYNEPPKGKISKRAFTTDFMGEWDLEYDPLVSLKSSIRKLNQEMPAYWLPRPDRLLDRLHYPVTASAAEWANEILNLDQALVEGFSTKWLRNKAEQMGRVVKTEYGSLKLLEECLTGLGFDEVHTQSTLKSLRDLHHLRSKQKGHAQGEEAETLRKACIKEHGSLKEHFRALAAACDESLAAIVDAMTRMPN